MPDLRQFALKMLDANPNIVDSDLNRNLKDVIIRGDAQEARRIAENLCQSRNISMKDAAAQAMDFFNIPR